jgi:PAS domain S-box-containing protein
MLESTAIVARTGWISWVGVDLGTKMVPVNNIRNLLGGIMLLAVLFAAGFALVDAKRLLMPLAELNVRAGQIGAGQYNRGLAPSGFAEIDRLAISLQSMAQAIQDREQSLISSEQRFRTLVNSIDGVVWEMDVATGHYLFVSDRSQSLLGYPPSKWLDDPDFWSHTIHPADREYLARFGIHERRDLARNPEHDLEYRFLNPGGGAIWVRDLISLVGEHDSSARLLGVMISIMDRKRAEAELARYRVHLEELVTQRTRDLQAAQNQLVQKERLAVLGQLTATVSHELRNPLGTVSNALYMVRETLGRDCLQRIERPLALAERSIQRCDGIISELFDFTRQRELEREPLSIDRWLAGVLDEMVWPANVRCHWHLASGSTVLADPERLRRALVNVVANALQAMDEKGPGEQRLEIRTRRLDDRCEIVVSDSGGGIPEQIGERIFEPLFSTKSFGVGLGVPIIRNIMTDHGGGVDYQSKLGDGTTVTLWLPLEATAKTPVAEG